MGLIAQQQQGIFIRVLFEHLFTRSIKMATVQPIVQPNLLELEGYNTQITYSTTSIVGVPQLSYTNRGKTLNFRGEDIQMEQTQLGQMVTVDISENPASEILEKLTLLIPIVNLPSTAPERDIQTTAIFNQIVKGIKPQVQTYMTLCLAGLAKQVAF
jgi:hypothetical protein